MPAPMLTNEIILAAIDGYEAQKTRIDEKISELRAMLAGTSDRIAATRVPTRGKRRKMSAAGRKAISEATKKRWAAFHAAKKAGSAEQTSSAKTKAKVSAKRKVTAAPAKKAQRRPSTKKAPAKKSPRSAAVAVTPPADQ